MRAVLLFITAVLLQTVNALHFYLGGDNQKCFYQDLPRDTVLAAKHSAWELEESTGNWIRPDSLAIQITIEETFDNNHRVLFQKLNAKGDFIFTAFDSGQHRICYRALSGGWFHSASVKMDIDFTIGEGSAMDSKNEEKLSTLAERVAVLNNKMMTIRREQALMREREAAFRDQSELTNARVVRYTFIQLFVLGCTCAWQLQHLRSFFMKQKLV
ncbi:protein Erp6p [Trichomonascus vanleenenianus]|uniref:Erp1p n=1 Tax=Trichomonascus vanleenenianus TaxID=2268995 RepID=UPI003EC97FF4